MSKILGEGTFSRVELVSDTIAIKHFHAPEDFCAIREIVIMSAVRHPNIVDITTASRDVDGKIRVYMKAYSRSIENFYIERLTPALAQSITRDILSAVAYLHQNKIWHKDIKPANVLYDITTSKAALCDFNISTYVTDSDRPQYCRIQSLYYRSPEIDISTDIAVYSSAIDVYSVGAIVFELYTHTHWIHRDHTDPSSAVNTARAYGFNLAGDHSDVYSQILPMTLVQSAAFIRRRAPNVAPTIISLLSKTLLPDPRRRITAADALILIDPSAQLQPSSLFVTIVDPVDIKKDIDSMTTIPIDQSPNALLAIANRLQYKSAVSEQIGPFYRKWIRLIETRYYRAVSQQKISGSSEDLAIFRAAKYIIWCCTQDPVLVDTPPIPSYNRALDILAAVGWDAM